MIASAISCLVATATDPDHAAERERAGIAHEDRGRRRVEPEKARGPRRSPRRTAPPVRRCRRRNGFADSRQTPRCRRDRRSPKLAAAIITGTMASPSRPSVRFTALPAPTMMKAPKMMKNQPRSMTSSLKNGNVSEVANGGRPSCDSAKQAAARDDGLDGKPRAAGKSVMGLPRHLQVVVVEADQPEAERHAEHDPDIGIGRIRPQQRSRRPGRTGSSGRPWSACRSW